MPHFMQKLSERDQRIVRRAAAAIAIYLVLFYGVRGWQRLETRRSEYQQLLHQAENLKLEVLRYETRALQVKKLMEEMRLDPAKLSKSTVVAQASAAIQKAAMTGRVMLGPIRESPGRPSARELASMQLEANGPPPALMAFLHRLGTLGYPLIIDSIQISAEPTRPGMVKLSLTVVVLDFEQWKKEEVRNA